MKNSEQQASFNLSTYLLLAIPLSIYLYKNGIESEDIKNFVFWCWIVSFSITVILFVMGDANSGDPLKYKKTVFYFCSFGTVNLILWVFFKVIKFIGQAI